MINSTNLETYAKDISKLTFEMEKICRTKEVFFCDTINLTPVEFRCLRYLLKSNFSLVKDLATNMDLTPSRVTNLLNSLEKKDYITRIISSSDRRIIKVNLTNLGKTFTQDIQNKYIEFHENMLSSIENENQLQDMLSSLKRFQQILENYLKIKENENERE